MFEDLRSPEVKAAQEAEAEERARASKEQARKLAAANRKFAGAWHPIETMPFGAYADNYGEAANILVADSENVAVASVSKRFGRPIKVIKAPTMALTDNGIAHVGGEYAEFDRPQWWFDWEFTDLLEHDDERFGKPEVGFVPTHWQPLPQPPITQKAGRDA